MTRQPKQDGNLPQRRCVYPARAGQTLPVSCTCGRCPKCKHRIKVRELRARARRDLEFDLEYAHYPERFGPQSSLQLFEDCVGVDLPEPGGLPRRARRRLAIDQVGA